MLSVLPTPQTVTAAQNTFQNTCYILEGKGQKI